MSNTNLQANNLQAKYAEIVELKKKQLELRFTPQANQAKDHAKLSRNLRAQVARLQRHAVKLRQGIELTEAEKAVLVEKQVKKTKKGKK